MSTRCLSLAALLVVSCATAGELRVCAEPDNLPYSRSDESGFENRIARVLADELGVKLSTTWFLPRIAFVRKTAGMCEVFVGVPSDFERLATTRPYYRSTYVFVSRARLASFDDPRLKTLRIGVQLPGDDLAATPAGHALAMRGAIDNVKGFPVHGDRPAAERIVEAIAKGELDAAVVWGPAAGHFAQRRNLEVQPASAPAGLAAPFDFAISVGVRRGNRELRDALDAALERRKRDIDAILDEYRVPRL